MVTRKIDSIDKTFLIKFGKYIEHLIIKEQGYRSLDAFALENHDKITKPTLYQICAGERDMKLSTLRKLANALGIKAATLLDKVDH